ncbi:hypothetical protein GCM10009762_29530 [Dermacoccus barathri]|uniref:Uncharacterized protein n=1 Tax=Dermacoccus barathri TaxID=322601 RepID=A0ABN2C9M0_9MICO
MLAGQSTHVFDQLGGLRAIETDIAVAALATFANETGRVESVDVLAR